MRRRSGYGFTLVELLVVIAIIGILIALLLPAVQAARDAARRTQCTNQLKQIGLALHNYHDTKKSFPPSNILDGTCCADPNHGNWAIYILPYMERESLYELYNDLGGLEYPVSATANVYNIDAANQTVRETTVENYTCPADIHRNRIDLVPASGPADLASPQVRFRTSSYRAVVGRTGTENGHFDTHEHGVLTGGQPRVPRNWRGALHVICRRNCNNAQHTSFNKPENISAILDGTANTLMVGEYSTSTTIRRTTFWAYAYGGYATSDVTPESRTLFPDYDKCSAIPGVHGNIPCRRAWGSFHGGGILNFLLCDGSVRAFNRSVSMDLLASLATMQGGEAVSLP